MTNLRTEIDTYLPPDEVKSMDHVELERLIRSASRLVPASVEMGEDVVQLVTNPLAKTEGLAETREERQRLIAAVRGMVDHVYGSDFCEDVLPYAHATEFTNGYFAIEIDAMPCNIKPTDLMTALFKYVESYAARKREGHVNDFETFIVSFTDLECLNPSFEDTLRSFVKNHGYYFNAGQLDLSYMHPGQAGLDDERKMFTPVLVLKRTQDTRKVPAFGNSPLRCTITNSPVYRTVGARDIENPTDGVNTEVGLLSAEVFQKYRALRQDPSSAKARKPKELLRELRLTV